MVTYINFKLMHVLILKLMIDKIEIFFNFEILFNKFKVIWFSFGTIFSFGLCSRTRLGTGRTVSSNFTRSVVSHFLLRSFSLDDSSSGWGTCRWHSNAQVSGVSYSAG